MFLGFHQTKEHLTTISESFVRWPLNFGFTEERKDMSKQMLFSLFHFLVNSTLILRDFFSLQCIHIHHGTAFVHQLQ